MVEGNQTEKGITRRKFTLGVMIASMAGAFASLFSLLKVLAPASKGAGYVSTIKPGDRLVYAKGGNAGSPVKASSMSLGDAVLVYPVGKTSNPANLVQLIKLNESDFKAPTKINLTDQGFVAYSAICTHLGCTVSWVKNTANPSASITECFCHNSMFDPAKGAEVIGGPAPIPIAQIGVKINGNSLVFTSDFTGPIGPQV
ncbi:MAG: ubiquinol-cytochrome c reductase iron-sulfur subunit [Nitrospiraceae bacterium]|nr:ubiquinol-cytochrome c reductase iron-sulfur subunit [Nitrospiraceae bacterium]